MEAANGGRGARAPGDLWRAWAGFVTGAPTDEVSVVALAEDGSRLGPVSRRLAHQPAGVLHMAVSVQLLDHRGLWLLQRRTATKPLFANRWANSCCTHPRPDETPVAAATRAVAHELGLAVALRPAGVFTYRAFDGASGLVEHELDHVFVGLADTSAAVPHAEHIADLAALPIADALRTTDSRDGAPWASEVLSMCVDALACEPLLRPPPPRP